MNENIATVVCHPAFVSLTQESEGYFILRLYDPLNALWEATGSLTHCMTQALEELPLRG
jgi:hypothetical protein